MFGMLCSLIFLIIPAVVFAQDISENGKHSSGSVQVGEVFPLWDEGYLDIHHINTGTGDATLFIFPDGTTFLLDAGASTRDPGPDYSYSSPPKPDASRRPGQWISRYIQSVHPDGEKGKLDYAALTHFHGDHMGSLADDSPEAESAAYRLTGITDVGEDIGIRTMIDRGWPDYDYPSSRRSEMIDNYRAFVQWHIEHRSMDAQQFVAGRSDQVILTRTPEMYPEFEFRNIAVNGDIWTGTADQVRHRFPESHTPTENNCSLAFRISYGNFAYFSGGDMVGALKTPDTPRWRDMESALAWVVGPVDVHVLNHHGYVDAANDFFLSILQPRVHIFSVGAVSHQNPDVMRRLLSKLNYPGPRDLFFTNGFWEGRRSHHVNLFGEEESVWVDARIEEAAPTGHIVVRVEPGGASYHVAVLDDRDEDRRVVSVHGPYEARGIQ